MLDAMFLIQRSLYLRLKQTRHPHGIMDLYVGSFWGNRQWGASGYAVTFPIAFNVVYNVLSIPQTTASTSNAYWGRFYITALNKNGFNVSDTGAGSNRWIAIGSA